jgi:hypothetical protein
MHCSTQTLVLFNCTSSCLLSNGRVTFIGLATILVDGTFDKHDEPQRVFNRTASKSIEIEHDHALTFAMSSSRVKSRNSFSQLTPLGTI